MIFDTNLVAALISGLFSMISAFGAIYLKEHLDNKKISNLKSYDSEKKNNISDLVDSSHSQSSILAKKNKLSKIRPIVILITTLLFGFISHTVRPYTVIWLSEMNPAFQYEVVIILLVLIALTLALAINHRQAGYQLGFQLENLSAWSGWISGWSFYHGSLWGEMLETMIPFYIGCCIIGGLIVYSKKARQYKNTLNIY